MGSELTCQNGSHLVWNNGSLGGRRTEFLRIPLRALGLDGILANSATGFGAGRNSGEFRYGIVGGKHVHFELTDPNGMVALEGLLWPPVGWLGDIMLRHENVRLGTGRFWKSLMIIWVA